MNYEKLLAPLKEKLPLSKLLADMGYAVTAFTDRPRKFSCNLHGDGQDLRKSACLYPDKDLWYCFACGKQRDIVSTIREVNGVSFYVAVKFLADKYNVKLDWERFYADRPEQVSFFEPMKERGLVNKDTAKNMLKDMNTFLVTLRLDNNITPDFILKMYDIVDLMQQNVENNSLHPAEVPDKLQKLKSALQKKMDEQFTF